MEACIVATLPLVLSFEDLVSLTKSVPGKDSRSDDVPQNEAIDVKISRSKNMNDSAFYSLIEDTYTTMLTSCIHSLLAYSTMTLIVGKMFGMNGKIYSCLKCFNDLLPIIRIAVCDRVVYQFFLQSHLELLLACISQSKEQTAAVKLASLYLNNPESLDDAIPAPVNKSSEWSLIAFTLGVDFVKQTKQYYWNVPYSIQGSEAIIFFESAFRSFVTIFQLVVLLDESDFLTSCNLDALKLLNAVSTSLQGFSEWIQKQGSMVFSINTLLSLQTMIEISLTASFCSKFSPAISLLNHIIRLSRSLLINSSNRFVISKILLDHIVFTEESRIVTLLASGTELSQLEKQRRILFPLTEPLISGEIYPNYGALNSFNAVSSGQNLVGQHFSSFVNQPVLIGNSIVIHDNSMSNVADNLYTNNPTSSTTSAVSSTHQSRTNYDLGRSNQLGKYSNAAPAANMSQLRLNLPSSSENLDDFMDGYELVKRRKLRDDSPVVTQRSQTSSRSSLGASPNFNPSTDVTKND